MTARETADTALNPPSYRKLLRNLRRASAILGLPFEETFADYLAWLDDQGLHGMAAGLGAYREGRTRRALGSLLLVAYILSIFGANWAIARFGFVPVGFGLSAPAGVFFAGLCFELRDLVQDTLGRSWVLAAIVVGALLSALVAGHSIAVASGVAFLLGELADFAVYTPLRRRWWLVAMLVANPIGDIVDSAVFLWIAFGSLHFLTGQVIGKAYCTLIPVGILWVGRRIYRRRRARVAAAGSEAAA